MTKQKTAMTQLIEWIDRTFQEHATHPRMIRGMAERFKKEEREQIIEAADESFITEKGEDYFKRIYGTMTPDEQIAKGKEEPIETSWNTLVSQPDDNVECSVYLRIGVQSFQLNMGSDGLRPKEEAEWHEKQLNHAINNLISWIKDIEFKNFESELTTQRDSLKRELAGKIEAEMKILSSEDNSDYDDGVQHGMRKVLKLLNTI